MAGFLVSAGFTCLFLILLALLRIERHLIVGNHLSQQKLAGMQLLVTHVVKPQSPPSPIMRPSGRVS